MPAQPTPGTIRLINDDALIGAVNMARDEALLIRVGRGESPPTLRLYEWSEPTVSLGYFQHISERDALEPPLVGMPVVRRLTGGGAILHDRELTYSLTVPSRHPIAAGRATRLYEIVHDTLIEVLADLGVIANREGVCDGSSAAKGPFFCFARRHRLDVLVGNDKLAGSAQRRTKSSILQHGSIIIDRRYEQQPAASLASNGVQSASLRERLPTAFGRKSNSTIIEGQWTDEELQLAESLRSKYAGDVWNRRV